MAQSCARSHKSGRQSSSPSCRRQAAPQHVCMARGVTVLSMQPRASASRVRPQTAARQAMLDFRRAASVPGGCLVIAPLLQAQVEATTELLTTCFSEAMRYPPIYRCAAVLAVPTPVCARLARRDSRRAGRAAPDAALARAQAAAAAPHRAVPAAARVPAAQDGHTVRGARPRACRGSLRRRRRRRAGRQYVGHRRVVSDRCRCTRLGPRVGRWECQQVSRSRRAGELLGRVPGRRWLPGRAACAGAGPAAERGFRRARPQPRSGHSTP